MPGPRTLPRPASRGARPALILHLLRVLSNVATAANSTRAAKNGWEPADFGRLPLASRHGRPYNPRPVVVLLLHIPKCGGTSVRLIFHRAPGWVSTHWSLSNTPTGNWHSNRLLHALYLTLAKNSSNVFVEWHVNINWSFVPELDMFVRNMRPGVQLHTATVLRKPSSMIASVGAYFAPQRPALLNVKAFPEFFLSSMLGLPSILAHRQRLRHVDVCAMPAHARLCDEFAEDEARERRKAELKFISRHPQSNQTVNMSLTEADYNGARKVVRNSVAVLDAIAEHGGCEPLVQEGMDALGHVRHILFLDSNDTMPIFQSVAANNLSFRPPPPNQHLAPTPISAHTPPAHIRQYKTANATALAREMNRCGDKLYARLRSMEMAGLRRRAPPLPIPPVPPPPPPRPWGWPRGGE
jgi:hypothetical protein